MGKKYFKITRYLAFYFRNVKTARPFSYMEGIFYAEEVFINQIPYSDTFRATVFYKAFWYVENLFIQRFLFIHQGLILLYNQLASLNNKNKPWMNK